MKVALSVWPHYCCLHLQTYHTVWLLSNFLLDLIIVASTCRRTIQFGCYLTFCLTSLLLHPHADVPYSLVVIQLSVWPHYCCLHMQTYHTVWLLSNFLLDLIIVASTCRRTIQFGCYLTFCLTSLLLHPHADVPYSLVVIQLSFWPHYCCLHMQTYHTVWLLSNFLLDLIIVASTCRRTIQFGCYLTFCLTSLLLHPHADVPYSLVVIQLSVWPHYCCLHMQTYHTVWLLSNFLLDLIIVASTCRRTIQFGCYLTFCLTSLLLHPHADVPYSLVVI